MCGPLAIIDTGKYADMSNKTKAARVAGSLKNKILIKTNKYVSVTFESRPSSSLDRHKTGGSAYSP